ncbi:MAG TPA: hypothetical protein VGB74_04180 [Actinoplanes sp.]|jgi:hypothetical protein
MTPSNDQPQPGTGHRPTRTGDVPPETGHEPASSSNDIAPGAGLVAGGYDQQPPTERDVLDSLADLLGWPTADGIWDLSSRDLGLRRPVEDSADLIRMVDHLMNVGDMIRVAGRSAKVRLVANEGLSRSVRQ